MERLELQTKECANSTKRKEITMKKFKIIAIVYAILAITVSLSIGYILPELEAKKIMVIASLPAIIGYAIYGILIIVDDIQELRFCMEYHKIGRNFKRLQKAAAIEAFDFSTYHIFGKVKAMIWLLFPPMIASMAILYVAIGFNMLNLYSILMTFGIFAIVFPLSWLDTVISCGLARLQDDLRICGEPVGY